MKFYIKTLIIIILSTSLVACRSNLKKPIISLYNNRDLVLNIELREREGDRYYGTLKIANISPDDLSLMYRKNIFLLCSDKRYEVYKDGGPFGIMDKSDYIYLKKNRILYWDIILDSKPEVCFEKVELEIMPGSYRKVQIYDKVIDKISSPEEIKKIINKVGTDKNNYQTIFTSS